jgi:hypothetical protein
VSCLVLPNEASLHDLGFAHCAWLHLDERRPWLHLDHMCAAPTCAVVNWLWLDVVWIWQDLMSKGKVRRKQQVANAPHYAVNYDGDQKAVYGQTPGSHVAGPPSTTQIASSPPPTAAIPVWSSMPGYAPPSPMPMQPLQAQPMYGQPVHMGMYSSQGGMMHGVRM